MSKGETFGKKILKYGSRTQLFMASYTIFKSIIPQHRRNGSTTCNQGKVEVVHWGISSNTWW